ncbi:MAG: ABC transporter ATP-binding protein [Geminicoccaceae bacterium]
MSALLLEVRGLTVEFGPTERPLRVVDDINFDVKAGEALGIVGESGSGKSMTSLSILRLVPEPPGRVSGEIRFEGTDLMTLPRSRMPDIRGRDIAMIFQEPMSSLNPVMTIGDQIDEALMLHMDLSWAQRRERTVELLRLVGMPDPKSRLGAYPSQFSGGMRQRVMIAIAVSCNPKLLIADEPTTALDVTIQAQVLELMKDIRTRLNSAVLLISHDLGVIADLCERVIVMYAGRIVEDADVRSIFKRSRHPYTRALLQSVPSLAAGQKRLYQIPGSVPQPGTGHRGCPFRPRCALAMEVCEREMPPLTSYGSGHRAACWAPAEAVAA